LLPGLDSTGKVHGALPSVEDLGRYRLDELGTFKQDLQASVQRRIQVTTQMGSDPSHGERQAAEQALIQSISKLLSGM
jgi:hypothetical protein